MFRWKKQDSISHISRDNKPKNKVKVRDRLDEGALKVSSQWPSHGDKEEDNSSDVSFCRSCISFW